MVTALIGQDHYKTELVASGHSVIADEPSELGGKNLGPSPGHFLQMSLASCTAITLRMYASRKSWPLEKIRVEVDSVKEDGKTYFQREIFLEGDLTSEQKERLLQIANACPVHKALTSPIEINTTLALPDNY